MCSAIGASTTPRVNRWHPGLRQEASLEAFLKAFLKAFLEAFLEAFPRRGRREGPCRGIAAEIRLDSVCGLRRRGESGRAARSAKGRSVGRSAASLRSAAVAPSRGKPSDRYQTSCVCGIPDSSNLPQTPP